MTLLVHNFTADGQSAAVDWPGGEMDVSAEDDFGGGTLTLEWSKNGGTTYRSHGSDTTFTASKSRLLNCKAGKLRFDLSGSTSPNLNARLNP